MKTSSFTLIHPIFDLLFWLFVFSFVHLSVWAGGPITVYDGQPVVWKTNGPISYRVDQGELGPLSYFRATSMVQNAFLKWNRVSTSWIEFDQYRDPLTEDVTSSNYERIINNLPNDTNPIIFDDDGKITNMLLGSNSRNHILGLTSNLSQQDRFVGVRVVFNGYFYDQENLSSEEIFSTFLHEIGHVYGLDHAQYARHLANNQIDSDDSYVSVMFPTTTDNDSFRQELTFDDKITISNLYPTLFHTNSTGGFKGKVHRGVSEFPGVNVIARDINDPVNRVVTTTTGYFNHNQGTYEFKGLPAGNYEVMVEAIDARFTGTSSVGQYAEDSSDRSFRNPIKPQYYQENASSNTGRSSSSPVNVKTLNILEDIDIEVDSRNRPDDEEYIRLLAIDSYTVGGAPSGFYSSFPFLLEPTGDEEAIYITVEFDRNVDYVIDIEREIPFRSNETISFNNTKSIQSITLGDNGDILLDGTRYFISVGNRDTADFTYTITVSTEPLVEPTPTRTFTPTSTPTPTKRNSIPRFTPTFYFPTFTHRPTSTPRPSPTPIPTFTPTITPTPTPAPLCGDINGDSLVNENDALIVLKVSIGLPVTIPEGMTLQSLEEAADINGDGKIMANDAILIYRKLANPDFDLICN